MIALGLLVILYLILVMSIIPLNNQIYKNDIKIKKILRDHYVKKTI
jgi:hypothetical protein